MKFGLRRKFLAPTLLLAMLGINIQGVVFYFNSKSSIQETIDDQMIQITNSATESIDSWIERNKLDIRNWSEQPVYQTASKGTFVGKTARNSANLQLARLKDDYKFYEDIHLSDLKGEVIASSNPRLIGTNVSEHQYFQEALKGDIFLSDIVKSESTGNPVFMIASPVKEKDATAAVLFGVIDLNAFTGSSIDSIKIGKSGYAFIYDQSGLIVAHPDKAQLLKLNMKDFDFGREMLSKKEGMITYIYNGVEKCVAFKMSKSIGWTVGVGAMTGEMFAPLRKIGILSILITISVGVFLSLTMWVISGRFIIKPISKAVARLKDIAEGEGDLTNRLEISSKDEVGELARWFNVFIEKLQTIIRDIAQNTETLTNSSTELSAISHQMSSGAEQASSKTNSVSSAAEEMNTRMSSIAATMEQTSTTVEMVASSAEEMASSINEIAKSSEKARSITGGAVTLAKSSSDRVEGLGKAAQEISKVTETITEISEQTNLLALNATIEAARAGEAGKGFAVVANEIKELAKQTAEATEEIRNKIQGIQDSISGTIGDIEQVPKVINDVDEIVSTIATAVEQQSATTREIAANVAQASEGIQEVTRNVTESSNVTGEIAREVSEVNRASGEMAASSSQVSISAGELSKVAEELKSLVGQFKV
ncbi:MAG: methyl-accepting chemotaxis protein [Desulfobacteraceae bacterium]|nr:MAG: methyl-accepting chemotaxis protein [Desulfobacteraceae bacterium]